MRIARTACLVSLLALGACASKPSPPPGPQPRPTNVPRSLPGGVSPATYVAQAASIDLFVVRSSELALVRSLRRDVRDFATRMIAAHQGTAAQLSFAGRRLDLLPAASMLPQHQAMYDELEAASDFDRAYLRLQRAIHGASLSLHADFAVRGASPTLRPVAENAAAVERSHLEMLRRL